MANVGYPSRERADGSPILDVRIESADGLSAAAANAGLPGYQVGLFVIEGSNKSNSESFANTLVTRLEKRWPVQRLPAGSGVLPASGCK
jgi:hypothetical protein